MNTADFDYPLPERLIAQEPLEPRDRSRLMKINRASGQVEHLHFYNLPDLLRKGDLLIVNDSRVLPARLFGQREGSGGAMEFLLLEQKGDKRWETMVRPGRKAKVGSRFVFGDGLLKAEILEVLKGGNRLAQFFCEGNFYETLQKIGKMPLPPYITHALSDNERYQTVYSRELGSAAAPTAGLHFTPQLMKTLKEKGVDFVGVTLHVGLGTFRPVKVEDVKNHKMHAEHYALPSETVQKINAAKAAGGRVIAVGTTTARTLESVAKKYGELRADEGYTDIFIYPGFSFSVLDGLITNFHLPQSTLIMLVSAFLGFESTMNAYRLAVENEYRFFSFGDAMFIG